MAHTRQVMAEWPNCLSLVVSAGHTPPISLIITKEQWFPSTEGLTLRRNQTPAFVIKLIVSVENCLKWLLVQWFGWIPLP